MMRWLLAGAFMWSAQATCPNQCSGHGECSVFSRCNCWGHFTGADCSEHLCPVGTAWADLASKDDVAHQNAECSNRGTCDRQIGACECQQGFGGNVSSKKHVLCTRPILIGKLKSLYLPGVPKDGLPVRLPQTWKMLDHARARCDASTRMGLCQIHVHKLVGRQHDPRMRMR